MIKTIEFKVEPVDCSEVFIEVGEFELEGLPEFRKTFMTYESDRDIKEIIINISSHGGEVPALMGMIDIVNNSKKDVWTIASGCAYSAGACLLACGHTGRRIIAPNASVMFHPTQAFIGGSAPQLKNRSKFIGDRDIELRKMIVENSNITLKEFDKLMKDNDQELWLTAQETVMYGFADFIGNISVERTVETNLIVS